MLWHFINTLVHNKYNYYFNTLRHALLHKYYTKNGGSQDEVSNLKSSCNTTTSAVGATY